MHTAPAFQIPVAAPLTPLSLTPRTFHINLSANRSEIDETEGPHTFFSPAVGLDTRSLNLSDDIDSK